jgi:hypothetical protein
MRRLLAHFRGMFSEQPAICFDPEGGHRHTFAERYEFYHAQAEVTIIGY